MRVQNNTPEYYVTISGLQMYYEQHGSGFPLVLLHGGGSTIESTFGRIIRPLAARHRVIAVELQAHGRTQDIDRPLSFKQDADDIAGLLKHLKLEKANVMGFSNGGTTALQLAIRYPDLINKLVVASAIYKRDGMRPGFFEGMQQASFEQMPQPLKEAFLAVNPDEDCLLTMFNRDVARMVGFKDIPESDIRSITAPTLIINGDREVVLVEHALELSRTLPDARLVIIPAEHGEYIGEICSANAQSRLPELILDIIEKFLEQKDNI